MKLFSLLVVFTVLSVGSMLYSQEDKVLFTQGLFSIEDKEELLKIESTIRNNPSISIVRLDNHSQRFFILTKGIDQLTEDSVKEWFGDYSKTIHCIQIGVYGTDTIDRYPFNCEK